MKQSIFLLFAVFALMGFDAGKSKVLIIGDSISIGYTPFVKELLSETAIVKHNPGNAQHTGTGMKKLEEWLSDGEWDIIQFNWGLWDLCYRNPDSKEQGHRDKINGTVTFSVEAYERNLTEIVKRLKQTRAKLIFVTTSFVPEGEAGRISGDEVKYNEAAKRVMRKNHIPINDIHKISKKVHSQYKQADGNVHYTPEGYKLLAVEIAKFIEKKI